MDLRQLDKRHFGRRSEPLDVVVGDSADSYLTDARGRKYIDFMMGWCVGNLCWGTTEIRAAARKVACAWMAKWFYGMPGRRVMDERLAANFLQQMTRRYGMATLIQIAAIPVAIAVPRVGVAIALLCVAFFLLPQPKPRSKPGEEPSTEEKLKE